jgi:dUTP pyrophosphatase
MIISKHERADWEKVDDLTETARGSGGFGHTGLS